MRRGALVSVQPGVGRLSTHVVTLMKKFTTPSSTRAAGELWRPASTSARQICTSTPLTPGERSMSPSASGEDRRWLDATLAEMPEKQLLLELGGRSLALPVNPNH